jgi:hypothetical protein
MSSVSNASTPVTSFLVAQRKLVSWVLLALAFGAFVTGGYYAQKTYQAYSAARAAESPDPEKPKPEIAPDLLNPWKAEHILGALGSIMLAAVLGGVGIYSLLSLPKLTEEARLTDARKMLILAGGLTGLVLMTFGMAFFLNWYGVLSTWLDKKTPPEGATGLVASLLVFLIGAGLAFASAQPARADERNIPLLRRLVFGMNLALSTFLLLLMLVMVNIFVALKVPNKLDTTASGANTLQIDPTTRDYLSSLPKPVTLTTTFSDEDAIGQDVRRLLEVCREANPANITVKYLSRALNREALKELINKYPQADFGSTDGILLTYGNDQEQFAFIPETDLTTVQQNPGGAPSRTFVGEAKLVKELLFLSDAKLRPIIYVTAGHGEIDLLPDPTAPPSPGKRAGTKLRSALEKTNVELRNLRFDAVNPRVPEDGSMLLIADPTAAFTPAEAEAVRTFLKNPGAGGKPTKLILFAGATPTPDKKAMVNFGLDGVLLEYGIVLGQKFILSQPSVQGQNLTDALAMVEKPSSKDDPFWKEFGPTERGLVPFVFPFAREVIVSEATKPPVKAQTLLTIFPSAMNWLETEYPSNPTRSMKELSRDVELQAMKQLTRGRRTLAAIVTENDKGRIAVFGSGVGFVDEGRNDSHSAEMAAQLTSVTVNWMREQPPVANITGKNYGYFVLNKPLDVFRAGLLPVLIAALASFSLGVGVWIVRRK